MNNMDPSKKAFIRIKSILKEDTASFKEKFRKNKLINKIKGNWLDILLISIIIIFATIFLSKIFEIIDSKKTFNTDLKGPHISEEIILVNSENSKITYQGDINNCNIEGAGTLEIKTPAYLMVLEGTFDNVLEPVENTIKIGKFLEGYIVIHDYQNDVTYRWHGSFDNYTFLKGDFSIEKKDQEITYSGNFKNNKLNGIGSISLYKDGKYNSINGWFENGIKVTE